MAGSEAIINKIIADATSTAKASISDANDKAKDLISSSEEYVAQYKIEQGKAIEKECELVLQRKATVALLDSRKIELRAKQDLIEECFDKASEKVLALPKEKYLAFIKGLLVENADDNDEVILSDSEKNITKEFIDKVSKEIGKKLTISKETGKYVGGVILRSKVCDKNLTLKTIVRSLRESNEKEVAEILFG